jgi:hypothetical protein
MNLKKLNVLNKKIYFLLRDYNKKEKALITQVTISSENTEVKSYNGHTFDIINFYNRTYCK